jgi:hypothetical protein
VVPKDKKGGYINNTKEHFAFDFNTLLGMETKQEKVFEKLAQDVCDSAI